MSIINTKRLCQIAESEFSDIVVDAISSDLNETRIIFSDNSFLDIWFSLKLEGRYSFHWERRAIDGKIFRHDNAPHQRWLNTSTFPKHYHDGSEEKVVASIISDDPEQALREFLSFVRQYLTNL